MCVCVCVCVGAEWAGTTHHQANIVRALYLCCDTHMIIIYSEPDEKYKRLREVASSYSIISMGVACFQWQPVSPDIDAVPCKAEVFNILMLSQQPYTMDPDSGQFLLKHGFDFNKQLRHGLPYSPVAGGGSEESGTKKVGSFNTPILSPTEHAHYYCSWWSCFNGSC